jgi:hypothetical protein
LDFDTPQDYERLRAAAAECDRIAYPFLRRPASGSRGRGTAAGRRTTDSETAGRSKPAPGIAVGEIIQLQDGATLSKGLIRFGTVSRNVRREKRRGQT